MKKFNKVISVVIATLMLIAVIPMSVSAKTLTTDTLTKNESVIADSNLLFSLDDFGATPIAGAAAQGTEITLSEAKQGGNIVTEDGKDLTTVKNGSDLWLSYVKETNFSLTSDEKYTVCYTVDIPENTGLSWSMFGFAINIPEGVQTNKAGDNTLMLWKCNDAVDDANVLKLLRNNANGHSASYGIDKVSDNTNFNGKHNFIISIDGKNISLFMGGTLLGKVLGGDIVDYKSNGKLALGMRIRCTTTGTDVSSENPYAVCSMSDIKVYKGAYYTKSSVNNYDDGDTLLKLKSPISATISDAEYNGSDFEDLVVTQTDAVNTFNKDAGAAGTNGTGDEFVWSKQYGSDSHWLETGVTTNLPLNGTTKYSLELKLKKVNENVEGIGIVLSYPGKNSNSQGIYFCDDKITGFQKTTTDMYPVVGSDDEKSLSYDGIWTKNLTDDGYTVVNLYIEGTKVSVMVGGVMLGAFDFGSYNSGVLAIGVKCQVLNAKTIAPNLQLASVKDVTVKAGALKDTRLYMQYTEVSEGKQSVRFISTLDSLEGTEAGFKITAVYKDAQGNIKNDKSWEKKVNVVYNSIIAEGDTYTAYDLGGRYLFAVSVNGVPTYEQIDFYVQSYVVVDGQTKWSEVERFTMGDGAELKGAEELEIPAN